jgi:hypothetical protein
MQPFRAAALLIALSAAPAAAQPGCPVVGERRTYLNERFGIGMAYPAGFELDPGSIPRSGDSARFWALDGRATAVVTASRGGPTRPLARLMEEAEQDVLQNARGEITYRRMRDTWFVISGHMVGRIFYQRTMLLHGGGTATLWIEFPRDMRPCLEDAVTTMSLSFRER